MDSMEHRSEESWEKEKRKNRNFKKLLFHSFAYFRAEREDREEKWLLLLIH